MTSETKRICGALRLNGVLAAVLAAVFLAGCVTTTDSVYTNPPSPEDALERRVSLARQYICEGDCENAKRNLS